MAKKKKITIASPHKTFILIALIGVAIGYLFGGILIPQSETDEQANIETNEASMPDDQLEEILKEENTSSENNADQLTVVENVSVDDDPSQGSVDAPITIIEFSDYQCPFCKRFYEESHETIIEDYVDTGKVQYVYRDFPLDSHPQAMPAAIAANCAGEQDRYWDMHDLLLERQDQWSFSPSADTWFKTSAAMLELDTNQFEQCFDDESSVQTQEILNDQEDGTAATVAQTPTIFINGKKVVGAQPLETYIAIIEGELLKLNQ